MKTCPSCRATFPDSFTVCPQDGTPLRRATELSLGTVLRGKYQILSKLGEGGMGVVYQARHVRFDEVVALKLVSSSLAQDATFLQRFNAEAMMMRKLDHPHALRVHDIDETEDGHPFIVMEYVEGPDLATLLSDGIPLDPGRAARIAMQVCDALAAAHRLGIVHRDIKPTNILLARTADGSEHAKVFDFGIAKVKAGSPLGSGGALTQTGFLVGTPTYMSPEQASGVPSDKLDGRTDLYSLGVVLYEMLTGKTPFAAETPVGLLMAHVQQAPPDPRTLREGIPPPLAGIVLRALEKDPAKRFASAEEMRDALRLVLSIDGIDLQGTVRVVPRRATLRPPETVEPDATTQSVAPVPPPAGVPTEHVVTPAKPIPSVRPADETQHVVTPPKTKAPPAPPRAVAPVAAAKPGSPILRSVYIAMGSVALLAIVTGTWLRLRDAGFPPAKPASSVAQVEKSAVPSSVAPAPAPPAVPAVSRAGETSATPKVSHGEQAARKPSPEPPRVSAPASAESTPAKTATVTSPQPVPPPLPQPVPQPPPSSVPPATSAKAPSAAEPRREAMRAHLGSGRAVLQEAESLRAELRRTPSERRFPLEQKLAVLLRQAIDHFESARQFTSPTDPNRPAVMANLAQAYEAAGRLDDAAGAYEEAARLEPSNAEFLLGWSTVLARRGKLREAAGACERIPAVDASTAGTCWRNIGIVLYNAGRSAQAIAPLSRATSLDPDDATGWYVLGASSLATMEFNRRGTRLVPASPESVEELFRKCIDARPSANFASLANSALLSLRALRGGVETRIETRPPSLTAREEESSRITMPAAELQSRLVNQVQPGYPPLAKQARVQGTVRLDAVIGTDGAVVELELQSGHPLLVEAAMDAVRQWRYQPVAVKSKPVEVATTIDVVFHLSN